MATSHLRDIVHHNAWYIQVSIINHLISPHQKPKSLFCIPQAYPSVLMQCAQISPLNGISLTFCSNATPPTPCSA